MGGHHDVVNLSARYGPLDREISSVISRLLLTVVKCLQSHLAIHNDPFIQIRPAAGSSGISGTDCTSLEAASELSGS